MFKEITIIGPGLIGASLGRAIKLKKLSKKIVGIDSSQKNLNDAIKIKAIDEARKTIDERIQNSSIVFICTPVGSIDQIVNQISLFSSNKQIISDVGSVKNIFKKKTLQLNNFKFKLVPGHPIAGTEHSGAINSDQGLFKNKWCILTPLKKNDASVKIISNVWEKVGMKVSVMKIKEHDKIMSITSHLPHLIAFTIVGTAFNLDIKKKKELINFAAGGFKDFTRIGSSDPKMWTDIFLNNNEFLIETLNLFVKDINKIKNLIQEAKHDQIFDLLRRTKKIRKSILQKENN